MKLMKLRSSKFLRSLSSNSKIENGNGLSPSSSLGGEIKWEVRPGGMLVQKRVCEDAGSGSGSSDGVEEMITLRVSTVSNSQHIISVQSTSTFGELKMILSLVTNMEAKEQRLLYRGKERDDKEYLHMVGVRDNDKVLVLEDPAVREKKQRVSGDIMGSPYRSISV